MAVARKNSLASFKAEKYELVWSTEPQNTAATPMHFADLGKEEIQVEHIEDVAHPRPMDFEAVRRALNLPNETRLIDCISCSNAPWTRAAELVVECPDGQRRPYFIKCASGEPGRSAIFAESASLTELSKYCPEMVPSVLATGDYQSGDQQHFFFVEEYVDVDVKTRMPSQVFIPQLIKLHTSSRSPTGKFGFAIQTWHGPNKVPIAWESSWCVFFTRWISQYFAKDIKSNGASDCGVYEKEFGKLVKKVIPALLLPLQAKGRYLKPSLLHGDLHAGNCGFERETGQPKMFDPAVYYGHNEMDMAFWRDRPEFEGLLEEYFKQIPPSEPRHQFDDRNRLYCIWSHIATTTGWPSEALEARQLALKEMIVLNTRYAQ